jgi:hypothetical protein
VNSDSVIACPTRVSADALRFQFGRGDVIRTETGWALLLGPPADAVDPEVGRTADISPDMLSER